MERGNYMERFTLKISGNKKISMEDLFPHEEKGFHPEPDEISEILDGISITELIKDFNLLRDLEITFIDNETGNEWVQVGFGWNKI
jgi:hypothetical protein